MVIDTFLIFLLGIAVGGFITSIISSLTAKAGTLVIDKSDEGTDKWSYIFKIPLDKIEKKRIISFDVKIKNNSYNGN